MKGLNDTDLPYCCGQYGAAWTSHATVT